MPDYRNLAELFENSFQAKADEIAIEDRCRVHDGARNDVIHSTKYGQLAKRTSALYLSFREQFKMQRDDVIAIVSPNRTEFIETYIASLYGGFLTIGVPHMFVTLEMKKLLHQVRPKLLVVDERYVEKTMEAYGDVIENEELPILVMDRIDKGKRLGSNHDPLCFSYESLASKETPELKLVSSPAEKQNFCSGRTAILLMTSGTTGDLPKVAMTTHQQHITAVIGSPMYAQNVGKRHVVPIYNSMAWIGGIVLMNSTLHFGGKIIIFDEYDRDTVVPQFSKSAVTSVLAMPIVLGDMCEKAEGDKEWLMSIKRSLRVIAYSGARTPLSLQKKAVSLFAPEVSIAQLYSQTEALSISLLPPTDHFANPNPEQAKIMLSAGIILRPGGVRIADEKSRVCSVDEVGEIQVRADPSFTIKGYYRAPEQTAKLFVDGWLRTGDLGSINAQNYLTICGRTKDLIATDKGYKVVATEVEDVLMQHKDVVEVAVAAIPSLKDCTEEFEYVCAFVVLQDIAENQVQEEELIRFCASRMASFKVPKCICFVQTLPRNRNHKVMKSDLVRSFQTARSA